MTLARVGRASALLGVGFVLCLARTSSILHAQASTLVFSTYMDRATVLPTFANSFLASVDFDGDGLVDLLVGGNDGATLEKTPIYLLVNQGNGSFRDATAEFVEGAPRACAPFGVTADFNNDGLPDVAIFDQGNLERGQSPRGGFYGEAPLLLVSGPGRRWRLSNALADAVLEAKRRLYPIPAPDTAADGLHIKYASAGDIDNDGDIDMYVESGGGYEWLDPHFMINNGDGTFTVDYTEERISRVIIHGAPPWRYDANLLVDLDMDGAVDLVLGQLRRAQNGQEQLASKIIFNDGAGHFRSDRVVDLPYAAFFDTWTYVTSIATADLNGDGIPDLVLAHSRGQDDTKPDEPGLTGRYIQILVSRGIGDYVDETDARMGDQSATLTARDPVYGLNRNAVHRLHLLDVDANGSLDLFMADSGGYIGALSPLIHLDNGAGAFASVDPDALTDRMLYFGEFAWPLVTRERAIGFIHSDLLPGPDGRYGTGDEYSLLIPTVAHFR